jgi:hypothetical protein
MVVLVKTIPKKNDPVDVAYGLIWLFVLIGPVLLLSQLW